MTRKQGEILLASVIIARSTSFLFSKILTNTMGTFNLLAVRSLLAFFLLLLLFWKRLLHLQPSTIFRGMLLGGAFFCVMTAELTGLRTTPSSTTAFLENTAIVFVPLFESILRRRFPRLQVVASTALALLGVGFLTLRESLSFSAGEGFCILAAVLYAGTIMLTDRVSRQDDPLILGILQVGFMGLFGLIASLIFESPRLPATSTEWGCILMLAVVCSGFGFTLQPVAQSHTSSERAGLFCALSPACAGILGMVFLKEEMGLRGLFGCVLVLAAVGLSQISGKKQAVAQVDGDISEP